MLYTDHCPPQPCLSSAIQTRVLSGRWTTVRGPAPSAPVMGKVVGHSLGLEVWLGMGPPHATCILQRATHGVQHATCTMRHEARNMQRPRQAVAADSLKLVRLTWVSAASPEYLICTATSAPGLGSTPTLSHLRRDCAPSHRLLTMARDHAARTRQRTTD